MDMVDCAVISTPPSFSGVFVATGYHAGIVHRAASKADFIDARDVDGGKSRSKSCISATVDLLRKADVFSAEHSDDGAVIFSVASVAESFRHFEVGDLGLRIGAKLLDSNNASAASSSLMETSKVRRRLFASSSVESRSSRNELLPLD
jgi:hypothetical protein